jgi:hypothetical protein
LLPAATPGPGALSGNIDDVFNRDRNAVKWAAPYSPSHLLPAGVSLTQGVVTVEREPSLNMRLNLICATKQIFHEDDWIGRAGREIGLQRGDVARIVNELRHEQITLPAGD